MISAITLPLVALYELMRAVGIDDLTITDEQIVDFEMNEFEVFKDPVKNAVTFRIVKHG